LQKVIIISYFFPPSNFVGGERTASWAKHLADNDIYPIIITRQWNENQKDLTDHVDENDLQIEKHDHCEIVRLPFKRSLRDRLSNYKWLKPLQKALTLKELIFSNLFISALPYSNFYKEVRNRLKEDPTIKAVIVSGRPFQSFSIGHRLKKEFDVLWIPDYRDEWTTHQSLKDQGKVQRYLQKFERKSELKWTSNADFFISVSQTWVDSISDYIKKPGFVVYNGYETLHNAKPFSNGEEPLSITYAGTLYPSQNMNDFMDACMAILKTGKNKLKIKFIGANVIPGEEQRLRNKADGFESNFEFMDRIPKEALENHISNSDILFLTGFENVKGWYPVKLFEYYATGKPILLCPSDNNVMEQFVVDTNSGFIANSKNECQELILSLIDKKENGIDFNKERNITFGETFSRVQQAANLAKLIHNQLKI
jgi:glycosyltransferase involved in cell wall biosynthesis